MPNNSITFGVDLLPQTTEQYDLGSSTYKWNNIYANQIYSNGLTVITSHSNGYGKISLAATTGTDAVTANTTQLVSVDANDTFTFKTGNKWLTVAGTNSTAGNDILTIGHALSGVSAAKTTFASGATTASANGGSIIITDVKFDEAGHITDSQDRTITLSQVTYSTFGASGGDHASGLVPDPGSTVGTTKFLREDAQWVVPTIQIPTTDTNVLGGIKVGYSTSHPYYAVEVDNGSNAYVTVPWINIYHTTGSWNGLTYTATTVNSNDVNNALSFTLPTGTSSTTIAAGNHVHGNITTAGAMLNGEDSAASLALVTNSNSEIVVKDLSMTDPDVPSTGITVATSFIDSISQSADGQITATKKDLPAFLSASGGTVTGNILFANTDIDLPTNNETKVYPYIAFIGDNDQKGARIWATAEDDGTTTLSLHAYNLKSYLEGETLTYAEVHGGITIEMERNADLGECTYTVNSSDNFRSAIGLPDADTADNLTFLRNDYNWYTLTSSEVSDLINLLDADATALTADDYLITQYVGGGTTTTTYQRRAASNVINATLVKSALGTDNSTTNKWLNQAGNWSTPTASQVGALALTGGTLSGHLRLKHSTIDLKSATNNVSSTTGYYLFWRDKNDYDYGVCQAYASSNGNIIGYFGVQNRDTSGTAQGWKGISVTADKEGNCTYGVTDKPAFRSAIGAGTSSLTIGTSSTTAAAGNHDHDSTYLKLSGGTLTGSVYFKHSSLVKGTNPSAGTNITSIFMCDKNGTDNAHRAGGIWTNINTSGTTTARLCAYDWTASATGASYFAAGITKGAGTKRTYTDCLVYGAVWNDYAEYRKGEIIQGGYCVTETASGILIKTAERLQPGCRVTSDTFGFAIGETKECQTPIAVSGRVLVYTYRPRDEYPLGAAVCSGPNGTVDLMTREEIITYPERIVGTVSEIPTYKYWKCGGDGDEVKNHVNVPVNNRIWIYVK